MTANAARATAAEPESARSISLERTLNAPRERVFEAFSKAEHLANWWGPNGFSITTSAFEFRVGGTWRFVMHGPDGRDFQNRVIFEMIERPLRIVGRHDDGEGGFRHDYQISFAQDGDQTRVSWAMVFPTAADRDHVVREYGAQEGLAQTTRRLVEYVAALVKSH